MDNKEYIVYSASIGDELLYIGSGRFGREFHCVSGCSHVYGLNKAHFENLDVEVKVIRKFLTKKESLEIEKSMIKDRKPKYNVKHVENRSNTRIDDITHILEEFRRIYGHDHYHKCRESIIEVVNLAGYNNLKVGCRLPSTPECRVRLKLKYSITFYEKIKSSKQRVEYEEWLHSVFEVRVGKSWIWLKIKDWKEE